MIGHSNAYIVFVLSTSSNIIYENHIVLNITCEKVLSGLTISSKHFGALCYEKC